MKISENNMWVKIARRYKVYNHTYIGDICQLMRRVIWSLMLTAMASYVFTGALMFAVSQIVGEFIVEDSQWFIGISFVLGFLLVVGSSVVAIAVSAVAGWVFVDKQLTKRRTVKYGHSAYKPRKPSVVGEWVKAKKSKMCTFIEIVKEDETK